MPDRFSSPLGFEARSCTPCRFGGLTCGACCWGPGVPRDHLESRLRRHGRLFAPLTRCDRPPSAARLLLHELRAHPWRVLVLAPWLAVAWIGPILRARLSSRLVCAFVAFDDAAERRVGCLLHPTRWGGRDRRGEAAFRPFPGFGCGEADFFCAGAQRFVLADVRERDGYRRMTAAFDWHAASRVMPAFPGPKRTPPWSDEETNPCP